MQVSSLQWYQDYSVWGVPLQTFQVTDCINSVDKFTDDFQSIYWQVFLFRHELWFAKVGVSSSAQPSSLQFVFVPFIEMIFPLDEGAPYPSALFGVG